MMLCLLSREDNDDIKEDAIPIWWLVKEYLGEMRIAGCQPRSETVEEIIREWRQYSGKTE